jgi:hypothetical protein
MDYYKENIRIIIVQGENMDNKDNNSLYSKGAP